MTTTTTVLSAEVLASARERSRGGPSQAFADIALVAGRNLRKLIRTPQLIVFSVIQPVLMLLLFSYVFGGIARVPGISYKNFIVPTVLVQALVFASSSTGIGLADDLQSGMIDRFRSLPIARSAVLIGRMVSDAARMLVQAAMLLAVATLIGFRFPAGVPRGMAVIVILVPFGLSLSMFSAWIGLSLRDPETVQVASFVPIFPLMFVSSGFAPTVSLPVWMRGFARANPFTSAVDTMRGLALGGRFEPKLASSAWHLALWTVGLLVVFGWLSIRQYRKV